MASLPSKREWSLRDFVAAADHEHVISADTIALYHTGDFIRLSVKNHPEVSHILVVKKRRLQEHIRGFAGSNVDYQDKTSTETVKVDSAKDYEQTLKEHYDAGAAGVGGTQVIDNVDITLTLKEVKLVDGTFAVIGQTPTMTGSDWADTVLTALGWVLGGLALIMVAYVGYRVYRHYRHGDALFPRLSKLTGGDE